MIKTFIWDKQGRPVPSPGKNEILDALTKPDHLTWISLEAATTQETYEILEEIFHFHPLTIEDCLSNGYQTPKVDEFSKYIFIITHALSPTQDFHNLETIELNAYLGQNFVVTSFLAPAMPPVAEIQTRISRDERIYTHGADFLFYSILDSMVDAYLPVIDQMEDEIELLEDRVLERPDPKTLERLLTLKHSIMSFRRMIAPQREVVNRLSRDDLPMIQAQNRIYFRDVYDHMVRLQDMTENIRDIVSGSLDIYLNSTSLRLNEIMKALTIVSTIFLPLSFIAGVYGMNFQYFPEITWRLGYLFVWGVFISIALGMILFFKKRGWF